MSKSLTISLRRIIPSAVGSFFLVLSLSGLFSSADNHIYDFLLRIKSVTNPGRLSSGIIGVDLTDNTELQSRQDLASRRIFADAFSVIKKSGCEAGFDFVFDGEKNPAVDAEMAADAGQMRQCVFAVTPLSEKETNFSGRPMGEEERAIIMKSAYHPIVKNRGSIPSAIRFLMSYDALSEKAVVMAHIGVQPDKDGVYRKIPLFYSFGDGYIPSYALSLAVMSLHVNPSEIIINAGHSVTLPASDGRKIIIPVDKDCRAYIPYTGDWESTGKHITLEKFASCARDEDEYWNLYDMIDGKILLFSDLSTSKKDFGLSPFEPVYPLAGIHISLLNGILTDSFNVPLSYMFRLCIAIVAAVVIFLICGIKSDRSFSLTAWVAAAVVFVSVIVMWFVFSIVPWCTGLLLSITVAWLVSLTFRQVQSYKEHLLMENALSRYFPRALAARILKEGKTDLTPAKKELTMLFSDIAGFTKWSSDKSPETVHEFLTDYLGSMAEIIFAHGGTVDKFIGDGMLAFFGDPYEQPDQTERAVAAGIEMQNKVRELAAKWKPVAGIDLKIRIGINSGEVIVGNLGTGKRIDYTVIGSAVNLASRMESNAPVGGILVAENAYVKIRDMFPFKDPVPVSAKGYDQPVKAYVIDIDFG